ncbi:Uncharacterised protein [Enterobacter asburiae]|uniref:Uncharacterized protein n=1 Tax=Enterobacter asburiae TaxID=61645 RepID=A0A376FAQ2_ENTAS|nr:Uncharacterised protein [Enterobacter asburiae]
MTVVPCRNCRRNTVRKSDRFSVPADGKSPSEPARCRAGRGPAAARDTSPALRAPARDPTGCQTTGFLPVPQCLRRWRVRRSARQAWIPPQTGGIRSLADGTSSICPSVNSVTKQTEGSKRSQPSGGVIGAKVATLAKAADSSKNPTGRILTAPTRRAKRASGSCKVMIRTEASIKRGPRSFSLPPERWISTGSAR